MSKMANAEKARKIAISAIRDDRSSEVSWAHNLIDAIAAALAAKDSERNDTLRKLATWIRTPGNIDHNDAIDQCARLLENNIRADPEQA